MNCFWFSLLYRFIFMMLINLLKKIEDDRGFLCWFVIRYLGLF